MSSYEQFMENFPHGLPEHVERPLRQLFSAFAAGLAVSVSPDNFRIGPDGQYNNEQLVSGMRSYMFATKLFNHLVCEKLASAKPDDKPVQVIITIGAPGSGKSTYIETCSDQYPDAIIFDATQTARKYRRQFIAKLRGLATADRLHIHGVAFNTPLEVCLERNSKRSQDRQVPEQIVCKMNIQFGLHGPSLDEGFYSLEVIEYDPAVVNPAVADPDPDENELLPEGWRRPWTPAQESERLQASAGADALVDSVSKLAL